MAGWWPKSNYLDLPNGSEVHPVLSILLFLPKSSLSLKRTNAFASWLIFPSNLTPFFPPNVHAALLVMFSNAHVCVSVGLRILNFWYLPLLQDEDFLKILNFFFFAWDYKAFHNLAPSSLTDSTFTPPALCSRYIKPPLPEIYYDSYLCTCCLFFPLWDVWFLSYLLYSLWSAYPSVYPSSIYLSVIHPSIYPSIYLSIPPSFPPSLLSFLP